MRISLRAALVILAVGLSVEALVALYLDWGQALGLPLAGVILGVGSALTLAGLLILWIGRKELNVASGHGFLAADLLFALSLVTLLAAVALVGWYAYQGAASLPGLASTEFALAVWGSLFCTLATFALIAFALSGTWGRVLVAGALGWAAIICALIASVLTAELPQILLAVHSGSMNVTPIASPVSAVDVYLWPTYALLLVAYIDAIYRLGRSPAYLPRPSRSRHAV
jgi:hypothetical protein